MTKTSRVIFLTHPVFWRHWKSRQ